jgi:hypothetical protein
MGVSSRFVILAGFAVRPNTIARKLQYDKAIRPDDRLGSGRPGLEP